jgi:hypothetical protein
MCMWIYFSKKKKDGRNIAGENKTLVLLRTPILSCFKWKASYFTQILIFICVESINFRSPLCWKLSALVPHHPRPLSACVCSNIPPCQWRPTVCTAWTLGDTFLVQVPRRFKMPLFTDPSLILLSHITSLQKEWKAEGLVLQRVPRHSDLGDSKLHACGQVAVWPSWEEGI